MLAFCKRLKKKRGNWEKDRRIREKKKSGRGSKKKFAVQGREGGKFQ